MAGSFPSECKSGCRAIQCPSSSRSRRATVVSTSTFHRPSAWSSGGSDSATNPRRHTRCSLLSPRPSAELLDAGVTADASRDDAAAAASIEIAGPVAAVAAIL